MARTTRKPRIPKIENEFVKQEENAVVKLETKPEAIDPLSGLPAPTPANWEQIYQEISVFRKNNLAPVDTVGCERLATSTEPHVYRYEILTSLQLSSQTKDQVTAQAIENLKQLPAGLTIQSLLDTSDAQLDACISKVGFHNRKTIYIKKTAQICKDDYGFDIPDTLEGLMALPGIGPKMAHLIMQCAWMKTVGIGVDTHVHRISNRLGWVKSKNAESTRKELEGWLPKAYWRDVNSMLVGFGQTLCAPLRPDCINCPVSPLCPKIGTKKTT